MATTEEEKKASILRELKEDLGTVLPPSTLTVLEQYLDTKYVEKSNVGVWNFGPKSANKSIKAEDQKS